MKENDINRIQKHFEERLGEKVQRVETHGSWLLLGKEHVYKFKKPVDLGFFDFTTLENRKYFCQQELELNRRLAPEMYVEVVDIRRSEGEPVLEGTEGEVIDHAVKMKRMDPDRQMDKMLLEHKVSNEDIRKIAEKLVPFHRNAEVIEEPVSIQDLESNFNDILQEEGIFEALSGEEAERMVEKAVRASDDFLEGHANLIRERSKSGFVRDCHGDLHSGNIFIYDDPVIFDCIEFNEAFRRIDILNELAFFCMDLEAHEENEKSRYFLEVYNNRFEVLRDERDEALFNYYKAYRANVRAKVTAIRASQEDEGQRDQEKQRVDLYLGLMDSYLKKL